MVAALILVMSVAGLVHFALQYRRALATVAATATHAACLRLAGIAGSKVDTQTFRIVMSLENLCPDLEGSSRDLLAVRLYSRILRTLRRTSNSWLPALAAWADRERTLCFRYVAVRMDERILRNRAAIAGIRSF